MYRFLILSLFSFAVHSTTFLPVKIEKQIHESSGVIQGLYQGKTYKKLRNDRIVTEVSFKVFKSAGINNSDLNNFTYFKVLVPGGEWQGTVQKVHGTPKFHESEEVVLFVKKDKDGYWLQNLSLGKYKVKKMGKRKVFISSVFPYHPSMGQISSEKFSNLVKEIKGEYFTSVKVSQTNFENNRAPANFEGSDKASEYNPHLRGDEEGRGPDGDKEKEQPGIMWYLFLLSLLVFASSFLTRKKMKN